MNDPMLFATKQDFRSWLDECCATSEGIWLLFGKKGGPTTLSANDALEEALCFGWIDGQMERIDDTQYKKYFARRISGSSWSLKNKKTAQVLIDSGKMCEPGLNAVEEARQNGKWDSATGPTAISEEHIEMLREVLKPFEPAYTNFCNMSASIQKTYARGYFDAKSDKTRKARLEKFIDRLSKNLKPM